MRPAVSPPSHAEQRRLVQGFLDRARPPRPLGERERSLCRQRILKALRREDAVLVAHYYTDPEIQDIAEESGGKVSDSLDMALFGSRHPASTLVVAGVRFMGETAKILTPEKRVLMPTREANCSLDIGCPADAFAEFCKRHPERTVVVYANTSAAVKARSDWVVTSSIALELVEHLSAQDEKILWAPDRFLGDYIRRHTGADMVLWNGSCIVHEEFRARGVQHVKAVYPEALVLAHPESPPAVLELSDHVGSTSQIIRFATTLPARQFIVATDQGLFHKLNDAAPDKEFIIAPTMGEGADCRSCARCPWMAMNGLQNLEQALGGGGDEIVLDRDILRDALPPLQRMLEFSQTRH